MSPGWWEGHATHRMMPPTHSPDGQETRQSHFHPRLPVYNNPIGQTVILREEAPDARYRDPQ